jgi:hypothetical protein
MALRVVQDDGAFLARDAAGRRQNQPECARCGSCWYSAGTGTSTGTGTGIKYYSSTGTGTLVLVLALVLFQQTNTTAASLQSEW